MKKAIEKCENKIKYRNKAMADRAAKVMLESKGWVQYSYKCYVCVRHHLTSSPPDEPKISPDRSNGTIIAMTNQLPVLVFRGNGSNASSVALLFLGLNKLSDKYRLFTVHTYDQANAALKGVTAGTIIDVDALSLGDVFRLTHEFLVMHRAGNYPERRSTIGKFRVG